jgi:bisphosphoglycerate-independent phosphoglycerate mutase (AlkP superfamily)
MDAQFLPGVLLCNRPWQVRTPTLSDMAPTILSACRLRVPSVMTGRNIFAS